MRLVRVRLPILVLAAPLLVSAQPNLSGAAEIHLALTRLNTVGSALMIAAHPDDEQSHTIAALARGRGLRTAYLSITRGDGGQNLIGSEQGDLLGLIRTQELLAARRIDGAEQFFTRAVDFGFTKSAQETLDKWGHEAILSDVVWVIRSFRPDVVILCFSGTPRDGHGQHTASAILGKEAFAAAADPKRFPEQLKYVQPWKARRLVQGSYRGAPAGVKTLSVESGEYNPVLGHSYLEIAGMSRSMHRSQGFGAPERRGASTSFFIPLESEPAEKDLFEGIDVTWNRVPGAAEAGRALAEAARTFDASDPGKTVPLLLAARRHLAALRGFWPERKLVELDETIALCAGLWLDASADRFAATPGSAISVRATALNRSRIPMRLVSVSLDGPSPLDLDLPYNQPVTRDLPRKIAEDAPYSQPYWLAEPRRGDAYTVADQRLIGVPENPPALTAHFRIRVDGTEIELDRPVEHRYVDRVLGERTRPFIVTPPVALRFTGPVVLFPDAGVRRVETIVQAQLAGASGEVRLRLPQGWTANPPSRSFHLAAAGEEETLAFDVTPPAGQARGRAVAEANLGGRIVSSGMEVISYPHIPQQAVFPPSAADLVRSDIRTLARRVGYIMGAGDDVPGALRQLGCDVQSLTAADLATQDLSRYDAIVAGVRAYNVRPDLRANHERLLEYVRNGGVYIVQYNVVDYGGGSEALRRIGPYPLVVGRDRVTVEDAPVALPDPASPLLRAPNRITSADFDGWVQERGLYFASDWDKRYRTLLESHDPGEPPHLGGTLWAREGKGVYIFSSYSWFRQLPAGVPGALRLFANFLSAAKVNP